MKPKIAILTDAVRLDNQAPLKYFKKLQPVHFYKSAPYGDLGKKELEGAIQYSNMKDLELKILKLKPAIIQGAEPYGSKTQLKLSYMAWKSSKKLNIPLIFPMLENRPPELRFGKILGPAMKEILKRYAKQATLIFALNAGAQRNLQAVGVQNKKIRSELYGIWGVDTGLFKPEAVSRQLSAVSYILFVGRLDEAKGITYILEAWQKIKTEFPKIELIFIGDGPLKTKIKGGQVKRLGIIQNQALPAYFAKALITLYPSVTLKRWEEQVGMVNLQSLACGTPVITTKSGAIPEYINDKVGILVPERDSKLLAEAMRKLLMDVKLRQKLGQNGRKYIIGHFEAQKTVQKVEKMLLDLLE